jgi:hypothetical protein
MNWFWLAESVFPSIESFLLRKQPFVHFHIAENFEVFIETENFSKGEYILKVSKPTTRKNQIQVHQDDEVLKQIFSREALPKDYGGEGPSLDELNGNVTTWTPHKFSSFAQFKKWRKRSFLSIKLGSTSWTVYESRRV